VNALQILYVEDDPDIREVVILSLRRDPEFRVHAAASGREALSLIDQGLIPDLILTDVMMPDMDGPATLAAIRTRPHLADTPVIFFSPHGLWTASLTAFWPWAPGP
jgi:CheY-like chemotaxis protein